MGTTVALTAFAQKQLEDPLEYLPCSTILGYDKGQTIYSQNEPSAGIYLVIEGKVKVCRIADDGRQVVLDIYQPDEFFGESTFLGMSPQGEIAVATEPTKVMTWTTSQIETIAARSPKLAIALLQLMVQRVIHFESQIESFFVDNISRRLARTLIRFSERLGRPAEDGSLQMMAFTHELLSQCIGTSREIVTYNMNEFRRQGYLQYSRKGILLRRDALAQWLKPEISAQAA